MKMKKILFLIVACLVFFIGCEDSSEEIESNSSPVSEELANLLNSMQYETTESGHLQISDDIEVIGTVEINSDQLTFEIEPNFVYDPDCPIGIINEIQSENVTVETIDPASPYIYPASKITLIDISLRFRKRLINTHPGYCQFSPVIELIPSSEELCDDNKLRCEADEVCYNKYNYCINCSLLSVEECACQDYNGAFDDGTQCDYIIEGDIGMGGSCLSGYCVSYN